MFRGAATKKSKSSRASGTSGAVDEDAIEQLYNTLADPDDPESISFDGIGKLGEMLEIDATSDVRLLVLLWKLGATTKPGMVTKKEFTDGMKSLRKDSVDGLKTMLPSLDPGFLERVDFRGGLLVMRDSFISHL
jgi:hypothetical protein